MADNSVKKRVDNSLTLMNIVLQQQWSILKKYRNLDFKNEDHRVVKHYLNTVHLEITHCELFSLDYKICNRSMSLFDILASRIANTSRSIAFLTDASMIKSTKEPIESVVKYLNDKFGKELFEIWTVEALRAHTDKLCYILYVDTNAFDYNSNWDEIGDRVF